MSVIRHRLPPPLSDSMSMVPEAGGGREGGDRRSCEEADESGVHHAEGGEGLQAGWLTARAPSVLAPQSAFNRLGHRLTRKPQCSIESE
jgi:hypothetical protein